MKKFAAFVLLVVLAVSLVGCGTYSAVDADVQKVVQNQDGIYNKNQPIPTFNYSLPRDLWIQFYKASTQNVVRTWSCEVSDYGKPISEIYESVGYPIPMDTQLTNPQKLASFYIGENAGWVEGVLPQSEPNGLYTSPNTNATIIMVATADGKVSPIYSEHKVQCWAFPVKWDSEKEIFVRTGESSINLTTTVKP